MIDYTCRNWYPRKYFNLLFYAGLSKWWERSKPNHTIVPSHPNHFSTPCTNAQKCNQTSSITSSVQRKVKHGQNEIIKKRKTKTKTQTKRKARHSRFTFLQKLKNDFFFPFFLILTPNNDVCISLKNAGL